MAEIKMNDLQEVRNSTLENFQHITPDNGTTIESAIGYWNDVFNEKNDVSSSISDLKYDRQYYDDNGKLYRINDSLKPDSEFEVRGYTYMTDNHGRTISAEGKLRIRASEYKRNMDPMDAVGKGDQTKGDQRGHLIAHQFEGSGGIENLSAMWGPLNRKEYASLENRLAEAVKDGADVRLQVEPNYAGNSFRPTKYTVSYSIDGERDVRVFRNTAEGI